MALLVRPGRHAPLRGHRRSRRRLVRRAAGTHLGADRAERRRQDDGVQRHHAPLHAGLGRARARRRVAPPRRRRTASSSEGIARTFQNINLFRTMSVLENVLVGAHARGRGGERGGRRSRCSTSSGFGERASFPAAALPYGTQKRVELARALVARPRLLLLDEPAGGLEPRGGRRPRRLHPRGSATTSS